MKIPSEILTVFEKETNGLLFGEVRFICSMRDGKPRFVITKEISLYPETMNQNQEDKKGDRV
jgi:hypothetical protein